MIIKFIKVEVMDTAMEGGFLSAEVDTDGRNFGLLATRKIKQGISNFYGEALHLPQLEKSPHILLFFAKESREGAPITKTKIAEFALDVSQDVRRQKIHGNLVLEHIRSQPVHLKGGNVQQVRLFLQWEIDVPFTRKSSSTCQLFNFEALCHERSTFEEINKEWRHKMKLYSPENVKRNCILLNQQVFSDNGQPEIMPFSKLKQPNPIPRLFHSKTMQTRSKTPSNRIPKNPVTPVQIKTIQSPHPKSSQKFHHHRRQEKDISRSRIIINKKYEQNQKDQDQDQEKFKEKQKQKFKEGEQIDVRHDATYRNIRKLHGAGINAVNTILSSAVGAVAGLLAAHLLQY